MNPLITVLAEYLDLSLNECLNENLNDFINSNKKTLSLYPDVNEKQLILTKEKNILIGELNKDLTWEVFIEVEKRIEFLSSLISFELNKSSIKLDNNINYKINVVYPYNITEENSCFRLTLKNKKQIINLDIKSTKMFIVFYPLLNRLKVEYLNRELQTPKNNPVFEKKVIKGVKKSSDVISLKLKDKYLKILSEPLHKCLNILRENNFIDKEIKLNAFINALSGFPNVKKIIWCGSPAELKYFVDELKPHLATQIKLRVRTVNSFIKKDSNSFSDTGQRGPKQDVNPNRIIQLNEAIAELNKSDS